MGGLEARLAENAEELDAAQALRYRVFYEELSATPSPEAAKRRRDFDHFDPVCDHLLVLDTDHEDGSIVVGTYRLMRRSQAAEVGGFYSAAEYDIAPLLELSGEILELGRSCVDTAYRTRSTMQLLWAFIAAYVDHHDIEIMFGCGSLPGTDPAAHAEVLSYLHYHHLAPAKLRPRALDERFVDMRLMPEKDIDGKAALSAMPPLLKGYLRVGGHIGEGAVIDPEFNTTDVLIIVATDGITEKYSKHYTRLRRENSD